jgi:hypothetical protein
MMSSVARVSVALLALAAGVAAVSLHLGCSGAPQASGPTAVRGRVTFQGRPVEGAIVVFAPDHDRGGSGKPIHAETGEGGVFQLTGTIPPGWYRVAIAPPPDGSAELAHFPPQLRRPDSSTVLREIESGKEHIFELAIEVPSHGVN